MRAGRASTSSMAMPIHLPIARLLGNSPMARPAPWLGSVLRASAREPRIPLAACAPTSPSTVLRATHRDARPVRSAGPNPPAPCSAETDFPSEIPPAHQTILVRRFRPAWAQAPPTSQRLGSAHHPHWRWALLAEAPTQRAKAILDLPAWGQQAPRLASKSHTFEPRLLAGRLPMVHAPSASTPIASPLLPRTQAGPASRRLPTAPHAIPSWVPFASRRLVA